MDNKIKIAVCDDSVFDRDITKMYIEDYLRERRISSEIICFSSGTEFLSTDLSQYALIFLDIYMDGINGVETAKKIVEENPHMKIIFCSSSPEFVDEAIEIDVMKYFINSDLKTRQKLLPFQVLLLCRKALMKIIRTKRFRFLLFRIPKIPMNFRRGELPALLTPLFIRAILKAPASTRLFRQTPLLPAEYT